MRPVRGRDGDRVGRFRLGRSPGLALRSVGSAVLTVLAGLAIVVTGATPALAHVGGGGPAPSNWRSPVTSVQPAMPGVVVRTVDNGDYVEVVNNSPVTVTVLGYDGEPYLRIGPDGVEHNTRSAATYLNRTADGRTTPPADADAGAAPVWQHVGDKPSYRWHDHRAHWMLSTPPPAVTAAPSRAQQIATWTVEMRYGTEPVTVTGTLSWVPGPSPWPWYGLAAGLGTWVGDPEEGVIVLPTAELLDRYELYIYKQWLRVYMRSKMIKHNKDLFESIDEPLALLYKLHIY